MSVESIADFYSETEVGRELLNRGIEQGLERSGQFWTAAAGTVR